jgi:predicted amidohydrolase
MAAMRVAAYQFDVRRDESASNLREVESGLRRAAEAGAGLVVLPEMWPTSFPGPETDLTAALCETQECRARLAALATELDLLVCGTTFFAGEPGARPTNRLEVLERGVPLLHYDKVHLFSPTAEDESFAPGKLPPPTADTRAGRVAGVVCYDLRFPELTRIPFQDGAEILCVPAQWPMARAPHFRALAVGLAVVNQCYVVATNRTGEDVIGRRELRLSFPGNSLIVDPHGDVLAEGTGGAGLVSAEIDLDVVREMRTRVPVVKDQRRELYERWSKGDGVLSGGF